MSSVTQQELNLYITGKEKRIKSINNRLGIKN